MKQVLLFLIIFFHINIVAQEIGEINYYFNIGSSVTIPYKHKIDFLTNYPNHPEDRFYSDIGYSFDLLASYNVNKSLSVISGLNYNYSRYWIDKTTGIIEYKGYMTNSYFNIPIIVKQSFSEMPISISFGSYIGILINAKENGSGFIDTSKLILSEPDPIISELNNFKYTKDLSKRYSDIDFGISLQFNYEFSIIQRFKNLIFTRLNYGLTNVNSSDIDYKWKNLNIIIGIGIKI